ncbi:unnamed protein product, partial [Didymodactylos carnosus]
ISESMSTSYEIMTYPILDSMPPYFTWLEDSVLAASSYPYHHSHIRYLKNHRIHTIVNIGYSSISISSFPSIKSYCLEIDENYYPTLEQCVEFVNLVLIAKQRGEVSVNE